MKHTTKSRRTRAIALGALVASVISIGAVTDTASAAEPTADITIDSGVTIVVKTSGMSLRSGIRW